MTKKELLYKIAEAGEVSIAETKEFYNIFEEVLFEAITSEGEVILSPRLGKFVLKHVPARRRAKMSVIKDKKTGKNDFVPTGKTITYPSSTKVIFKVALSLKTVVKNIELQ